MGSGRGKTRRAAVAITTPFTIIARPRPDYNAWFHKFVRPQEIGMETVSEYYGVRKVTDIAAELIRDMEKIGSFTLPPGASMDEFHIYIANDLINPINPKDSRRGNSLFIRRVFPDGSKLRAKVPCSEPRLFIKPHYKIGSTLMLGPANDLAQAMAALCAADGANNDTIRRSTEDPFDWYQMPR